MGGDGLRAPGWGLPLNYAFSCESFEATYSELESLYREHYAEMTERLAGLGVQVAGYAPRLPHYIAADRGGWLLTLVLRDDGMAVGYCNVYITNDMHNGELIAQEDTVFVTKAHRNGVGKKLVQYGISILKERGVKRLLVAASTDLRVAKLWKRMGFKEVAMHLAYTF